MRVAAVVIVLAAIAGIWWIVQGGETQMSPTASSPIKGDEVRPTPKSTLRRGWGPIPTEPVPRVIDASASFTQPTPQVWNDRCAILRLRESYQSNPENEDMCGWTEKPTRP